MANYTQKSQASDDEDDLESLRLAALQSLKQKALATNSTAMTVQPPFVQHTFNNNNNNRGNHRPFKAFRGGGRPPRGGLPHYRVRTNTNLISIQTVPEPEIINAKPIAKIAEAPKLILPQDRYANAKPADSKPAEEVNKFNRYDNSEDSDSDSEPEDSNSHSEPPSPGDLKKADSLEQLMDELEHEICDGDEKESSEKVPAKKRVKTKKPKKPKPALVSADTAANVSEIDVSLNETTDEIKLEDDELIEEVSKEIESVPNVALISGPVKENLKVPSVEEKEPVKTNESTSSKSLARYRNRSMSPVSRKKSRSPVMRNRSRSPLRNSPAYRPRSPRSPRRGSRYSPLSQHYERPLSPLNINTDVLNTIAMAPLSPRSAAFVLENRKILERRRMSPRRSYSRSPTPPSRRYSPPRYSHRDKSYSPGRREPRSKRKSRSPIPSRNAMQNRLGNKTSNKPEPDTKNSPSLRPRSRSSSLSLSPTPERSIKLPLVPQKSRRNDRRSPVPERGSVDTRKNNEEKPLDPVLEARRKKFETPVEIKPNSPTVIRLKPRHIEEITEKVSDCEEDQFQEENREDEAEYMNESDNEDLEEDSFVELSTKVDDIFSDEESDDEENEGRFKSSSSSKSRNVTILPFTKLINGAKKGDVKSSPLSQRNSSSSSSRRNDRKDRSKTSRRRSRSPIRRNVNRNESRATLEPNSDSNSRNIVADPYKEKSSSASKEEVSCKSKVSSDVNKTEKEKDKKKSSSNGFSSIEDKKNEIKSKSAAKNETRDKIEQVENIRKVEISSKKVDKRNRENSDSDDDFEPEIIVESEDDSIPNEGGDLRAQLSRKRAERQNKTIKKVLPTRLLQSALQEVVVSKVKKIKSTSKSAKNIAEIMDGGRNGTRFVQLLPSSPRLIIKLTDSRKPIHMRLGVATADVVEGGGSSRKKKRKLKNRIADQV